MSSYHGVLGKAPILRRDLFVVQIYACGCPGEAPNLYGAKGQAFSPSVVTIVYNGYVQLILEKATDVTRDTSSSEESDQE